MMLKHFWAAGLLLPLSLFACNIDVRDMKWLTTQELEQSLKGKPRMAVGFDVDETVLFSSPSLYHAANEYCKGNLDVCVKNQIFWDEVSVSDSYNLPKKVGMGLVKMHLARGDKVYFITARPPSPRETLSEVLREYLNAPTLQNVIFTGFAPGKNFKVKPLTQLKISIFYGDSDSDMSAAMEAHARPIRILRAKNSIDPYPTCPGIYHEEVIMGSDI